MNSNTFDGIYRLKDVRFLQQNHSSGGGSNQGGNFAPGLLPDNEQVLQAHRRDQRLHIGLFCALAHQE
jgi:hypothetical protein